MKTTNTAEKTEPTPPKKIGRPRRAADVGRRIVAIRLTDRELAELDRRVRGSPHTNRGDFVRAALEL